MPDEYAQDNSGQQVFTDMATRLRDTEDKQRLLKDRVLIVGQSLIKEKEKSTEELREMKTTMEKLKLENEKMKEMLQRITEQLSTLARKEELAILERQFELFR